MKQALNLSDGHGLDRVEIVAIDGPVRRSSSGFTEWLAHTASLLVSALREIFDESAYLRFLNRRRIASSRKAYADFCREYEMIKSRRPRCC